MSHSVRGPADAIVMFRETSDFINSKKRKRFDEYMTASSGGGRGGPSVVADLAEAAPSISSLFVSNNHN